MSLETGTRLGPYEVTAPIGAGGMGEVYKAKDTRLERTVAIKVLPEHLAESPERKARFEREAKAISQLNHPHICTLYDVGEQDGTDFIVMEFIEGETLAERLKRRALKLDQALEYGIQIADGLDKAHRAGIVHRDLKPGNVMLTKSGVKLLDFGLARLVEGEHDSDTSDAPTRQKDLTAEESIIGTLQYMAPEQLERKQADTRTDIFALGALLYEMVTGTKAFDGASQASLISAIMTSDPPPMESIRAVTPPALDHVVQTCLSKDADERWQSVADVRRELEWIATSSSSPDTVPQVGHGGSANLVWKGLAMAMTVVAVAAIWIGTRSAPRTSPSVIRSTITLPEGGPLASQANSALLAISPDGSFVSYAGAEFQDTFLSFGLTHLYLRRLDELDAQRIPGTEGAETPFFSPDGQWLGFIDEANGQMKKLALSGGAPVVICDASNVRGASWGPDGTIVFTESSNAGLFRVPSSGGEPEPLTTLAAGEKSHRSPRVLPDGRHVLFTISTSDLVSFDDASIALASLDTGSYRVLIEGGSDARYVSSGHIVYVRAGSLLAVPFDLERLEVEGGAVPVVEDVSYDPGYGAGDFDVSRSGLLIYASGDRAGLEGRWQWVHRDGSVTPLSGERLDAAGASGFSASLSPDGTQIALQISAATDQIWIYDVGRGSANPLTHAWDNIAPSWSPDGKRVTFLSNREGPYNVYWQVADGSAPPERLLTSDRVQWTPASWSPDGRFLAYAEGDTFNTLDIWIWDRDTMDARNFLQSQFNERHPSFSPDGRWLAYVSDESGIDQVYVEGFPGPGGRHRISTNGGTRPRWSHEGNEIVYVWNNQALSVGISSTPELRASQPRVLYEGEAWEIDVAPDDTLLAREPIAKTPTTELHLVQNWLEELKRLVPTN